MTISDTAKQLGINPKQLFQWLSDNNWIFKRSPKTPWVGYQTRINSGFLEHRSIVVENKQGTDMTSMQVRVTPKGLTVLADKVSSGSDLQTEMF
jgi:phage antirepressor YoqD-like protein